MDTVKLSTKRVGYIGEQVVARDLIRLGHDVYYPAVDDNKVDMVVEVNQRLIRVQVKTARTLRGTTIQIQTKQYVNRMIDIIAIYYEPKDIIAYYPYRNEEFLILAIQRAKNNQEKGRNWFYQYLEFPL
jgi:hypothetical protein